MRLERDGCRLSSVAIADNFYPEDAPAQVTTLTPLDIGMARNDVGELGTETFPLLQHSAIHFCDPDTQSSLCTSIRLDTMVRRWKSEGA